MMHPSRRKKKRINYGVRAVELVRGTKGYGFTISGQQPCILSCIVSGSPAEQSGLRAGDYLVAVNGYNVAKSPHDDVVKLIGNSKGVLRLQIAENYYSDSSDEEGHLAARTKPKYSHRSRSSHQINSSLSQSGDKFKCTVEKVVNDLKTGAMFDSQSATTRHPPPPPPKMQCSQTGSHRHLNLTCSSSFDNLSDNPSTQELFSSGTACSLLAPPPKKRETEKIVHRTVVGYLGTIDIPNQLHPSMMMQVLKKCIKRLKQEKRNPTTVLLTIHVTNIKLTNADNQVIAEYPSYRIIFCNAFSESDKQFFGILTKSAGEDGIVSNSCHVFMIFNRLIEHSLHVNTSSAFGFVCTRTTDSNVCQEFPDSCMGLIGAIQTLYIVDGEENYAENIRRQMEAVSPQPSNLSSSTAHSSNSDSGIGFRDDYGQEVFRQPFPVRNRDEDPWVRRRDDKAQLVDDACREGACPNAGGDDSCQITSAGPVAAWSLPRKVSKDMELKAANDCVKSTRSEMCCKLSPKVFNVAKSMVHSLENLKEDDQQFTALLNSFAGKSYEARQWTSLQEIRNVDEFQEELQYGSTDSCDKEDNNYGVHTWASGFEKLLKDPVGLQTFAEFLKKEFSHENIYFWAACERYKNTEDTSNRRTLAWKIYERHLSATAGEPVNVDSHAAGQITQELINYAPADLFLQAQKQVFNLMKFDSYPRFLRSDLYRNCLETGSSVVSTEDCDLSLTNSPSVKLKKSHSDAEDRRRKSILPWNRKNRSKSKDRGESEYNKIPTRVEPMYKSFSSMKRDESSNHNINNNNNNNNNNINNNEDNISISSSRSSLASWDLALRQSFSKHLMNLKYSSSVLAGQEVEVVPAKVLKVDLPSRRIITVVAHKGRTLREVLRPLLNKYGFKLELITIWGDGHPISLEIPAINAPARLVLTSNNEDFQRDALKCQENIPQGQTTLDEITNKVFEELLVGKSANKYQSEGSCKSEDQRSESSSILSNKFFSRDLALSGKKKSKSKSSNLSEKSHSDCAEETTQTTRSHAPLIAKWRNGVMLQLPGRFDGDELYEGLKRAQRSRLEDQRGTEINFELPDFLKDKENSKSKDYKKLRRARLTVSANCDNSSSKFFSDISIAEKTQHLPTNFTDSSIANRVMINESRSQPSVPTQESTITTNRSSLDSSLNLDVTLEDADKTIIDKSVELSSIANTSMSPMSTSTSTSSLGLMDSPATSPTKLSRPPPLPPKPKGLLTSVKTNQLLSKNISRSTIISDSCESKNVF
ncbi:regulator of G protein signaling family member locomotion defects isoform X2 [Cotesia typhae]|uniref:regulator of G protein signaling family member locomotion defects isoform X2 n=1 Tax=Cotesia typhae TaxID=2053667 RepID=UPI003D694FEB